MFFVLFDLKQQQQHRAFFLRRVGCDWCAGNNITLRTLDLSWNHIRKKGAFGFSKGLKVGSVLQMVKEASKLLPAK